MPGATIGTQMSVGYPGQFSRNGDCVINARQVKSSDTSGPLFGAAVVLNQDSAGGTISDAAVAKAAGHSLVMTQGANYCFVGVAAREIKTLTTYNVQPTSPAVAAGYLPGQYCDIVERGAVTVQIQNPSSTTVVSGGNVYVRLVSGTGTVIGAFEPAADGGNTVQITNAFFTTGIVSTDANGNLVAEITLLNRNCP
jgi:hypothetical protein